MLCGACVITGNTALVTSKTTYTSCLKIIKRGAPNPQGKVGRSHRAKWLINQSELLKEFQIVDENGVMILMVCIVDELTWKRAVHNVSEQVRPPPSKKRCVRISGNNTSLTEWVTTTWVHADKVGLYRYNSLLDKLRTHYAPTAHLHHKGHFRRRSAVNWCTTYTYENWTDNYHRDVFEYQRGKCTILWSHVFDLTGGCGLCIVWKCESLGIVIELLSFNNDKLILDHHSWIFNWTTPKTLKELAASKVSQAYFNAEFTPPLCQNRASDHHVNFAVADLIYLCKLYLPTLTRDKQKWFMMELFRVLGGKNLYTLQLDRHMKYLKTIVVQVSTVLQKAQEVRRGGRLRDGTLPTTHHVDAMKAYDAFIRGDSDRAYTLATTCDFMNLPAPILLKGRIEHEMRPTDFKRRILNSSFQNEYQSELSCIVDADGLIRIHSGKNPAFHTTIDLPALFASQDIELDDEAKQRIIASLTR